MLSRAKARRVVVEHLTMSAYQGMVKRDSWIRPLARQLYRRADAVVAVSQAAADDLQQQLGLDDNRVDVIYNPVVGPRLLEAAALPPEHPWLVDKAMPVFLGVGRLTPQKDFTTLLRAFALVNKQQPSRLILFGEGECRRELKTRIQQLGLEQNVSLAGFVANPYAEMQHADCLVLSSRWEALPTVIIEALACGCPVVSTDCPSGPREILEAGKHGPLVPPESPSQLAEAMLHVLNNPPERRLLQQRGSFFSVSRAAAQYFKLFERLLADERPPSENG